MILGLAVAAVSVAPKLDSVLRLWTVLTADIDPLALEHRMALGVVHTAQEEHIGGLVGLSSAPGTCRLPSGAVLGRQ